ncbi:MAG: hypothetical protein LBR68_03420 [Lachnoclostridium sp.]|jgi:predicted nucleic acid-binding protein|nr:hypothetical protein [Lachnoclostridium sp.]
MNKLKIYLDICSYNRPFDDQSQMKIRLETEAKLYIQEGIRKHNYSMVWSYMLDFENHNNPYEDRKRAILLWKDIADEYCTSSDDILTLGEELMQYGIKECDSLQIACAIKSDCDYFITTDRKLLNKPITSITIINPINFILEMEGSSHENR